MRAARRRDQPRVDTAAALRDLRDLVARLLLDTIEAVLPAKAEQTARQWFSRTPRDLDDEAARSALADAIVLAVDLETFTPSLKGTTALDRVARQRGLDRARDPAYEALKRARFLPFVVQAKEEGDLCRAENLVTRQSFTLFDDQFPPAVIGVPLVARICPLDGEVFGLVGIATPLDDAGLAVVLDFVRPGRGIISDHRCAAAVYRHVVRHGTPRILGVNDFPDEDAGVDELAEHQPHPIDRLAARVHAAGSPFVATPEILDEARRLVSIEAILEVLFRAVAVGRAGAAELGPIYRRFAEVQIEALHLRALAGSGVDRTPLDTLSRAIDREIALNDYPREARDLCKAIRRVVTASKPKQDGEDLTRVIERIRGLRAKTIDQGCTEDEAIAAANKVAELLDRYGLSLGEIDLREQACRGFGIESTRKRTGSLDECLQPVARFCDCRAWHETSAEGTIRSVFFGLPADVEAARYLFERVAMAFQTETATFQSAGLYAGLTGGGRAKATKSFQLGLARGITERLVARKAEREETLFKASGRDLVPVKASIVDEELGKLGMAFTSKEARRSQLVLMDAYEAGQVAGRQFAAESTLDASS